MRKILTLSVLVFVAGALFAEEGVSAPVAEAAPAVAAVDPAALAAETEAYAASTEGQPLSPELIVQKVNEACELFKKEGAEAGLRALQGKGSKFVFSGTYIWVHDMDCVMVMHPIKYKMNGKSLVDYNDNNGKFFFVEMNNVVRDHGQGWVDYMWPKPGEKDVSQKVSFVKGVEVGGKTYVLGCGVYGFSPEKIEELKKH